MSYSITVSNNTNSADTVTVSAKTPTEAIVLACDMLGLLDAGCFSLRHNANGTLAVSSSVPSLSATLITVN